MNHLVYQRDVLSLQARTLNIAVSSLAQYIGTLEDKDPTEVYQGIIEAASYQVNKEILENSFNATEIL